jgi:hypothetical protein
MTIGQLAVFHVVIQGTPDWAEKLTGLGTVAIAIIALFAAGTALHDAREAREKDTTKRDDEKEHALQERAIRYLERYSATAMIVPRERLHRFIRADNDATRRLRIERWERMSFIENLRTIQALNFWEELGGMYNRQLVDREIVDDYFGPEAVHIWKQAYWFVEYERKEVDPEAMLDMEKMCLEVHRKRKAAGKPIGELPNLSLAQPVPLTPPVPPPWPVPPG